MARKKFKNRSDVSKKETYSLRYFKNTDFLEEMLDRMTKATDRAEKAIDDTLVFVEASNRRIAAMEAQAASFRKGTLKN